MICKKSTGSDTEGTSWYSAPADGTAGEDDGILRCEEPSSAHSSANRQSLQIESLKIISSISLNIR